MVAIYTHPIFLKHDTGPGHPECPARMQVLHDLFAELKLETIRAPEAELEWIARAHADDYIDRLQMAMPESGIAYLDGDTVVSPHSWDAAIHAAGAVCQAVADVIAGKTTRAFCAVRPPGHHAEPAQAMGFCLFNNIFVGALHAQHLFSLPLRGRVGVGVSDVENKTTIVNPHPNPPPQGEEIKRVAIVDFDVHHGNGSDTMVRAHENVFYISSHQWPLFPGTGGPDDQIPGRLLNIPLPAGTGSVDFRAAYERMVFPALNDFKPDLLMISAGFDAHRDDPLAQMNLLEDDFAWVTEKLCEIADRHCGGRVVSVLEGGYNLTALKSSVAAHLKALSS